MGKHCRHKQWHYFPNYSKNKPTSGPDTGNLKTCSRFPYARPYPAARNAQDSRWTGLSLKRLIALLLPQALNSVLNRCRRIARFSLFGKRGKCPNLAFRTAEFFHKTVIRSDWQTKFRVAKAIAVLRLWRVFFRL